MRDFFVQDKPVGIICHGPWMLVEANVAKGRTVTSWPSLETDLRNAGADWVDREVVVDNGLVTSRKPDVCRPSRQDRRGVRRGPPRAARRGWLASQLVNVLPARRVASVARRGS